MPNSDAPTIQMVSGVAFSSQDSQLEAVIVPGGGVRAGGALPPWVASRCDRALQVARGAPIILLSAGTPHRPPPIDDQGFPLLESKAAAAYLLARGAPPQQLWTETSSYDTIGNAFFCRVIHTDPRGLRHLAIVNSAFHMPRTRLIFNWLFSLSVHGKPYQLSYEETPNSGLSDGQLEARLAKERAAIERLASLTHKIRTLGGLHRFLYGEHDAYVGGGLRSLKPESAADTY